MAEISTTQGRGQPVYPLTVATQLVGLSPRSLRGYEEAGLIEPARVGGNRQRMYSEQDLQWVRCIRDMIHDEGLTVVGIRRLLDLIPCWEVRHCSPQQALACAPHQNVPNMAGEAPAEAAEATPRSRTAARPAELPETAPVEIKLIYGVQELGAVLPCSRCISAERAARRVAMRHGGKVAVSKHDLESPEAAGYGVLMVPAIVVGDEIVSSGKGISEDRLDAVVRRHLAQAGDDATGAESR